MVGYDTLSDYQRDAYVPAIESAYLLLEYISPATGRLSETWLEYINDAKRRANLYKDMSRMMVSLARLPQPHIGSFRFNTADGTISLSGRPMFCSMMLFENGGTPHSIQPGETYNCTDAFASDLLSLHDNHFIHDPHTVRGEDDARERMAIRALLRTVMHYFILLEKRSGPFPVQFTDLRQRNIFVDDQWNVTCLIDLEWISALPVELFSVPYWITNCSIDEIVGDQYKVFYSERRKFVDIMEQQIDATTATQQSFSILDLMKRNWDSKAVWFWTCLRSISGWLFVFEDQYHNKIFLTAKLGCRFEANVFFLAGRIRSLCTDQTRR